MAKITPIDVVKDISGKDGNRAVDNFATNKRCNKSSPICDSTRAPTRKNE